MTGVRKEHMYWAIWALVIVLLTTLVAGLGWYFRTNKIDKEKDSHRQQYRQYSSPRA
ncbi:hypothetical protein [Winkia neuii]|uniref:Uncharacterized protein n=2 Tax=Winkia neuii TaxID=33007 RepID=K0YR04_9ACTO|nr:hypothetical protein [Winkia neuii]EJZ85893.1 hypothetical protein HMPREF9240_01366 [Winkia neuii BV029A5]MDK8595236.1 hypothetical protein [Winkia sp. UMB1096A]NJJ15609.1 hypothetical protein [Winkia neuii]WEB56497.1 hypothetical protein PUW65_08100 [Winkia neuii]